MRTDSFSNQLSTFIRQDDADAVQRLLSEGARERRQWWRSRASDPPLVLAASANSVNAARVLLQHRVEADEIGRDGYSPLEVAAQLGHREMCRLLLQHGAVPSRSGRKKGIASAVTIAAYRGDFELVDLFLNSGADPDDVCSGEVISLLRIPGNILRRLVSAGGRVPEPIRDLLSTSEALGD